MRNRRGRRGRGRPSSGPASTIPGYPLTMASSGEYVRVVCITTDHAAESRLVSMGINPGALLQVLSASERGPIVVSRDESRFGIDRKTAWHVRVVPASPGATIEPDRLYCNEKCRGCSYRTEMLHAEYGEFITLDRLLPGQSGSVTSVRGRRQRISHLMEQGLTEGAHVSVLQTSQDDDRIQVSLGEGDPVWISGWDALHVIVKASV